MLIVTLVFCFLSQNDSFSNHEKFVDCYNSPVQMSCFYGRTWWFCQFWGLSLILFPPLAAWKACFTYTCPCSSEVWSHTQRIAQRQEHPSVDHMGCFKTCCLVTQLCPTQPHGLEPARLLCPWESPGKNTGVGCHFLLQEIFLTQGSNLHILPGQADSLLSHQASREAML